MAEQDDDVIDLPRDALSGSVGARLKQAREARGLSIDSVGRAIKLAPRQVEAIEADDFGSLMSPTYVRGFIRNYAALIGLDAQVLLGSLDQQHVRATPQLIEQANVNVAMPVQSTQRKWLLPLLALSVPVLAGLALYIWFEFWPAEAPVVVEPPAGASAEQLPGAPPLPDEATMALPPEPVDVPAPEAALPPVELASSVPAEAGSASVSVESPTMLPGQRQLDFTFATDSWVEVRDAKEVIVLSDLNRAGSSRTVHVAFPVSLVIGNARSVTLKIDGQAYDLTPSTKVDVARLRLD